MQIRIKISIGNSAQLNIFSCNNNNIKRMQNLT